MKFYDAIIELCNFYAHVFSHAMLLCPIQLNMIKQCEHYLFDYSCNAEDISNATEENRDKKLCKL